MWRWKGFRQLQEYAGGRHVKEWEEDRQLASQYDHVNAEQLVFVFGQGTRWESFVGRQQPSTIGEGRFPIYVKVVKDRLTKHGFTRTFQLDEGPARQDKFTRWIEYLGSEYWWYDQYALSQRQEQRVDEAWKRLVDAKVLRPFETEGV